jgi:ankyrin repeat protein
METKKRDRESINAQDGTGTTCLHNQCVLGSTESIYLLLTSPNLDPNLRNKAGYTPLQTVVMSDPKKNLDVFKIVLILLSDYRVDPQMLSTPKDHIKGKTHPEGGPVSFSTLFPSLFPHSTQPPLLLQ